MASRELDIAVPGAVDGRPVRARLCLPAGPGPFPWALLVHGYTLSSEWGAWPELARRLAERGVASARVAYSGDGVGDDLRSVEDVEAFGRNTYVAELADLATIGGCVGERPEFDADRRALVGHSRGGGIGAIHVAEVGGYRGLALWAAFDKILWFTEERLARWREQGWIDVMHYGFGERVRLDRSALESAEQNRERLDVLAACGRLTVPVLVVHGARDQSLPVDAAQRLAAATPRSELFVIEDAGHAFGVTTPLGEIPDRLERLLTRTTDFVVRQLTA